MSGKFAVGCLFISMSVMGMMSPTPPSPLNNVNNTTNFEDLVVDRYYVLRGGIYEETGGWGCPYPGMGMELTEMMKYWNKKGKLDAKLDEISRQGFWLSQTQYHGKPYCQYDDIPLTKDWLVEFYMRHKNDTMEDWYNRHREHYARLRDSGWKISDDYENSPKLNVKRKNKRRTKKNRRKWL